MFRMAKGAKDRVPAYRDAMKPFTALNRIENDHPLPLMYYYRGFIARGDEPTEQAKLALERAAELAPFDKTLWMNVGLMQAGDGKIALAKRSLAPLAADPHGGSGARAAKLLLLLLQRAKEGEPFDPGDKLKSIEGVEES